MSYTALTSAQIATGQPTSQDIFNTIKTDLDYFNTSVNTLNTFNSNPAPITFVMKGADLFAAAYNTNNSNVTLTGIAYTRVWYNITLSGARLWVITQGSSGTFQVDCQRQVNGSGAFSSIFSTKPSVAFNAAAPNLSTNAVLSTTALLSGDVLRFDIVMMQLGAPEIQLILPFTGT